MLKNYSLYQHLQPPDCVNDSFVLGFKKILVTLIKDKCEISTC